MADFDTELDARDAMPTVAWNDVNAFIRDILKQNPDLVTSVILVPGRAVVTRLAADDDGHPVVVERDIVARETVLRIADTSVVPLAVGSRIRAVRDFVMRNGEPVVKAGMEGVIIAPGAAWPWRVRFDGIANAPLEGFLCSLDEIEAA